MKQHLNSLMRLDCLFALALCWLVCVVLIAGCSHEDGVEWLNSPVSNRGVERRVFLVFYPEFPWFNDVIAVRQSAD